MSLRMVEIIVGNAGKDRVLGELATLEDDRFLTWNEGEKEDDQPLRAQVIMETEAAAELVDRLEKRFSGETEFRIVISPVQATIPRLEEHDENAKADTAHNGKRSREKVIREELRTSVAAGAALDGTYVLLATLSAIVASIGLLRGVPAVVIGAMVIAPLLGPNVGLALATVLGDTPLAHTSLRTLLVGLALVLLPAFGLGYFLGIEPISTELLARTEVGLSDVVLALAAGIAGIISLGRGTSTALVGVMVALALVPPLAACGLFLGAGHTAFASKAALLVLTNVVCLNLAGVIAFAAQGVQPLRWSDQKIARSAMLQAMAFWMTLLGAVCAVIILNVEL